MFRTPLMLVFLFTITTTVFGQQQDKRTAFPKMTFIDNHPYVPYQDNMVKLLGIADRPVAEYIAWAKEDPTDWKYSMVRYTHYMWDDMDIARGDSIQVTFEQDGQPVSKQFALHIDNRDLATDYYEKEIGQYRIDRQHETDSAKQYQYLTTRLDGYEPTDDTWLTKEEALHDLEHLEWQIVNNYSYRALTGFNYPKAIDAIIADLKDGITKTDFALQLKMLMANFGDGHSGVSMYTYVLKEKEKRGNLPFKFIKHDDRFYAIDPAAKDFYDPAYPMIVAINDQPIEEWYALAEQMVAKSTPDYVQDNTLGYLGRMALLVRMNGAADTKQVKATFSNGKEEQEKSIAIGRNRFPDIRTLPLFKDTLLDGNIGYLAMNDKMEDEDEFLDQIHQAMQHFKNTKGLIIDIRDNGGGSRDPLLNILPYLVRAPVVANVARYRIDAASDIHPPQGYLDRRYAYPADYEDFSTAEKAVIAGFQQTFKPKYEVEARQFSEYHYLLIGPETVSDRDVFYYDKPVIVLIDEGCFSASDIFAAGIKQGDQVRLLGNTTGGGSGFTKSRTLPNSEIRIRLSRIVSYQPDGHLYDGHGVLPDIEHPYTLKDKLGQTDSMLEVAIKLLGE